MPRRPTSGPPYTNPPAEVYVVVTKPWGMDSNPRMRTQGDFNRIASWAQYALQQSGLNGGLVPSVECIYGMGTRDEIILQFAEGTNVIPLLGEHRWADFSGTSDDPQSTRVFLYNWRNNGDPANHNWTENFPRSLPLHTVPAKSPYPTPSWTSPPSTLINLVHPIPRPAIPIPILNSGHNPAQGQQPVTTPPPSTATSSPVPPRHRGQTESREQPVAQDSASTDLFRPYEPPSHHPSHAQFLNRSRDQSPSTKSIKKLDPYELEEDALNIIRSFTPKQEGAEEAKVENIEPTLHPIKVEIPEAKTEEDDVKHGIASNPGYQPSQALIDAFNSLRQTKPPPRSTRSPTCVSEGRNTSASKADINNSIASNSGYQPSQALIDAFNSLRQPEQSPSVGPKADINAVRRGTAAPKPSSLTGSDTWSIPGTRVTVKREYEDDVAIPPATRKKIKVEED